MSNPTAQRAIAKTVEDAIAILADLGAHLSEIDDDGLGDVITEACQMLRDWDIAKKRSNRATVYGMALALQQIWERRTDSWKALPE